MARPYRYVHSTQSATTCLAVGFRYLKSAGPAWHLAPGSLPTARPVRAVPTGILAATSGETRTGWDIKNILDYSAEEIFGSPRKAIVLLLHAGNGVHYSSSHELPRYFPSPDKLHSASCCCYCCYYYGIVQHGESSRSVLETSCSRSIFKW